MRKIKKIKIKLINTLTFLTLCLSLSHSSALVEENSSTTEHFNCVMAVCFDMTGENPAPLFFNSSTEKVEQCSKGTNTQDTRWIPIDIVVQNPSLAVEYFKSLFSEDSGDFEKLLNGPLSCSKVADVQSIINIESPTLYAVSPVVEIASQEEIQSEVSIPTPNPSVELVFYGSRGCSYPIAHVDPTKSCQGLTASNNEVNSVRVAGTCFNNSIQHIESACWNFKDGLSSSSGRPIYYASNGCKYPIAQQAEGVTCEELSRRAKISTDADFSQDLVTVESFRDKDGRCHNVDRSMAILDACKQLSSF